MYKLCRTLLCLTAVLLSLIAAATPAVPSLPDAVRGDAAAALAVRGDATMRFFGIKVYDIRLWTAMQPLRHGEPFALELVYDLSLKGADIARRSVEEMRKQGWRDEVQLQRWEEVMRRIFPDIKPGDTLIGLSLSGREARFYSRDRFIAAVADPEFTRAFFDIWLSENTSEPKLRTRLLGASR